MCLLVLVGGLGMPGSGAEALAAQTRASPAIPGTADLEPLPRDAWRGVESYDILFIGGRLVDGSGNAWRYADVAVLGDRIVAVAPPGALDRSRAGEVIEIPGLVLAPGFIDINGQSEFAYLEDGRGLSKLYQGITTEIMGESNSASPVNGLVTGRVDPSDTTAVRRAREWQRFDGWGSEMEARGVTLNVGSFLGGTTVRRFAMGLSEGRPTPSQLDTMRAVTARSMQEGAFGVASALIYAPGTYAETDELIEISRVVAEYGGLYITHMRSESYHLLEAIDEAIRIGAEAEVPVEIFHLKAAGVDNWHLTDAAIARIDSARAAGVDVAAGMYPYTAASTGLTACLPPWIQADGRLYRNLRDPVMRARIREEILGPPTSWENWCRLATPEGSVIASVSNPDHVRYVGWTLDRVAADQGKDWIDTMMDFILADRSRVGMIYFAMDEENVRRKLALPWMKFGTDGSGWNPDRAGGQPHPRAYGTYPRILGQYVREEGVITLEDAVRKSSWMVADRLGLRDRGLVVEGFFADLVIFDPETIRERATFERPHQLAEGVRYLFVNGVGVIREGGFAGVFPGRFLRGPGYRASSRVLDY